MKSRNTKFIIACVAAGLCGLSNVRADDNKGDKGAGAEKLTGQQEKSSGAEQSAAEYQESSGAEKTSGEKSASSHAKTADDKFAEEAIKGGLMEVKMGELAAQKGESASVKQFGERLAKDHREANEKLKQIWDRKGQKKNISDADKQAKMKEIGAEHQKMIDHLSSLSGAEFDKAFIEHAVKDHQKDIKKFEKEASEGEDPAIRSFASETLPKLREHLQIAQTLQANPNASLPAEVREPAGAERDSDAPKADDLDQQEDDSKEQEDDTKKTDAQITP